MIPRITDRNTMRTIGLFCLLIGSVSRYFLHPAAPAARHLFDGGLGLVFGVSIGTLLLSLRSAARPCSK